MNCYVVTRRGRWLVGRSYATGLGYSYQWSASPYEAQVFPTLDDAQRTCPRGAKVAESRISPQFIGSIAKLERGES